MGLQDLYYDYLGEWSTTEWLVWAVGSILIVGMFISVATRVDTYNWLSLKYMIPITLITPIAMIFIINNKGIGKSKK